MSVWHTVRRLFRARPELTTEQEREQQRAAIADLLARAQYLRLEDEVYRRVPPRSIERLSG